MPPPHVNDASSLTLAEFTRSHCTIQRDLSWFKRDFSAVGTSLSAVSQAGSWFIRASSPTRAATAILKLFSRGPWNPRRRAEGVDVTVSCVFLPFLLLTCVPLADHFLCVYLSLCFLLTPHCFASKRLRCSEWGRWGRRRPECKCKQETFQYVDVRNAIASVSCQVRRL